MRKFLILLKKEIRELLTAQVILPLLVTAVIFFFLGNVLNKEQKKANQPVNVAVVNEDSSEFAQSFIAIMKSQAMNITISDKDLDQTVADTKKDSGKVGVIRIPDGFGASIGSDQPKKIGVYTFIRNFSMMGGRSYGNMIAAIGRTNEIVSNQLLLANNPTRNPETIKNPVQPDEFTIVADKEANISPNLIMGFVSQQTTLIPILLFFVIVFASQMIATAIANEKENKTLETLLTAPVSRNAIVIAKMAGAGIIALVASVVYIIGFRSYINGASGGAEATNQVKEVIQNLGLTFTPESYVLLGISLFVGILIALSISLILGAFAEDVKSVAGLTTPIMFLVMIPYFLTLFLDINSLSNVARYAVYAIPFSHVFLASPNLFMHNYLAVILGILYQLVWFIAAVYIAAKIFSNDKIVTMKLNFSKKKR